MLVLLLWQLVFQLVTGIERERCLVPRLENGRAREKGKFARNIRFNCQRNYQLLGHKYAHCVRGNWDVEIPVCIKAGCSWAERDTTNGLFFESYRGALVKVVCNPGYATSSNTIYCDGYRWNGTFPKCIPQFKEPAKFCDFEEENLCGWVEDPSNKGAFLKKSLEESGPPPKFGHTSRWFIHFGSLTAKSNTRQPDSFWPGRAPTAKKGNPINMPSYNTYLRPSSSMSRLFSPVYPPSYISDITCFSFWYYMQGATAGILKAYLMWEGQQIESVLPDVRIFGDQGPSWQKKIFRIPQFDRNFQIIIEGSGDSGYDIAIDDVSISYDEECFDEKYTTTTETEDISTVTDAFDTIDDFTCRDRCSDTPVLIGTNITSKDLEESGKCDCHPGCLQNNSCCEDYNQFCSIGDVLLRTSTAYVDTVVPELFPPTSFSFPPLIKSTIQVTPRTSPNAQRNVTSKDSLHIRVFPPIKKENEKHPVTSNATQTSQSEEITNRLPMIYNISLPHFETYFGPTSATPIKLTTTKRVTQKTQIIPQIATKKPTTVQYITKKLTTLAFKKKTTKAAPKSTAKSMYESNYIPRKPFPPSLTKDELNPNYINPDSTNFVQQNHYVPNQTKRMKITGSTNHEAVQSETPNEPHVRIPLSLVVQVSAGAGVSLLLIASLAIFLIRRRRRFADSDNMAEDSDVRFLTSDEVLDFTIAKPADSDL